ncbi:unnamed protein product [Sphagnum tenellum]
MLFELESYKMKIDKSDTALVLTDPQNEVLSEGGLEYKVLAESLKENNTVANIERLLASAKSNGFPVFISPHYIYPSDQKWILGSPNQKEMLNRHLFARKGPLILDGFIGSGADWVDHYKPYIEDGETIVVSPHKIYSPQVNDLVLQLQKRKIRKIILGGMIANLCVESHLRDLTERGFEVAVVKDATAAPRIPELGDGYRAALTNYYYIASAVLSTHEVVNIMNRSMDTEAA